MDLGLGVGLSKSHRGVVSGEIPAVADDPPGSFDGFETPPTVETIADTVVVRGKTKAGFIGKFVVPLGDLIADRVYNVNFVADLSGLAQGGAKSGFGFGMKNGNSFRLTLLQGDGVGVNATTVRGSPPNGWNKQTGHTTANGGAPTSGTQHAADVQLVTNAGGDSYTFSTSGDDQETWDAELEDQALTPFADVAAVEQFGIAGWFAADDAGEFTITVTWTEAAAAETDPYWGFVKLLIGPTGVDGGTTISDEGPLAHGNATVAGDAQIDTGIVKFSASLQCDGTGDWISYADSDDWRLSTDNDDEFTVEGWVRFNAVGANTQVIVGQRIVAGTPVGWVLQKDSLDRFQFAASSDGTTFNIIFNAGAAVIDTWYHVAVDKDSSNVFRLYLDGTMIATQTPANGAIADVADSLGIGARSGAGGDTLNGRLEEVRITKGKARYASDDGFTPPTERYPRS